MMAIFAILLFCLILPEKLYSTPRKFVALTAARRFLSSAGTAVIIGLQGSPILVSNAYGPTDVDIKIQRFEILISDMPIYLLS